MVCVSMFHHLVVAAGLFVSAGLIWWLGQGFAKCQEGKCQLRKLQSHDAKEQEGAEN